MEKLLVIDGNSILNRAYYGIRPLSTKDGQPTNAIFGFVNILKKHLDALSPEYMVCAFDVHAPTFRHKMYDAYKAGRHPTPDDLLAQFPLAKETAAAMGFTVVTLEGYEADDILGTAAEMASRENVHTYLLTGDRDSLQLVSDKTTVILTRNKEDVYFDPAAFRAEYGVDPSQYVDVKALMGDSSDNIPGVAGIGEKNAFKLIAAAGSLDALYNDLDGAGLTPSVRTKLEAGHDSALFSRTLATICREAPLPMTLSDFRTDGFDKAALCSLFEKLEFHAFYAKFGLVPGEAKKETEFFSVPAPADVSLNDLPGGALAVSFDRDTNDLYLSDGTKIFRLYADGAKLRQFFSAHTVVCHDLKSLCHKLSDHGITPICVFDTMLAAYLLSPGESRYPLGSIILSRLGTEVVPTPETEAFYVSRLYPLLAGELENAGMTALLREIELPLAPVLADMEEIGFRLDTAGLTAYSAELGQAAALIEQSIYEEAGRVFNINSPKQLSDVLYGTLGLPTGKKRQSGYSTDAETLEKLRPYHPIIQNILDYRTLTKLKSTYGDALVPLADENGRIHTTFNQTGTATGRLSSADPNLQNIPVREKIGRELRKFFTADTPTRVLLDADYSQIELRLLAELSGDKTMSDAFRSGADIHASTASQVFHVPMEEMTPEIRARAKAVNFGIVYGIGDYSLSVDLGISRKEAANYIETYLATYPDVDRYLKDAVSKAHELGYATTKFGRRRPLPELKAKNKMTVAFGERVAMNSPIQGTAADVIKLAMIRVHKALRDAGIDAKLLLQVHDELIIECATDCKEEATAILRDAMEHAIETYVPLSVEVSSGYTWFEAK